MNWYYVDQGQQAGPVDDAQLEELRQSGRIQPETLVWREGMANWTAYREAKGESGQANAPAAPPPSVATAVMTGDTVEAVCAECGKIFPKDETIRFGEAYVCRNCKPVFMQKLAEGARLNVGGFHYAGFWIRVAAKLLDGLIIGLVVFIPLMVVMVVLIGTSSSSHSNLGLTPGDGALRAASSRGPELIANLFGFAFQFLAYGLQIIYSTFFNGRYGATPGKMICRLKIVDSDGNRIGYGRAFGRGCAELLSNFICSIGYLIAAFDSQKRALHDHICNTRVIYKEG
jgi:uncharacterized RDD family membrane protein YckC